MQPSTKSTCFQESKALMQSERDSLTLTGNLTLIPCLRFFYMPVVPEVTCTSDSDDFKVIVVTNSDNSSV